MTPRPVCGKIGQNKSDAVLWHQGESDCAPDRYPFYEEKLTVILDAFRKKLGLDDVPSLLGGLGDDLQLGKDPIYKNYFHINHALKQMADKHKMMGFVSAEGLGCNSDKLHFAAKSLREFGVRYYQVFCKMEDKSKVFLEKLMPDLAIRNDIEHL